MSAAPKRSLGSMWVFSLNSFQLISPIASGWERRAAANRVAQGAPARRSTTFFPPTRRASKPGATGAIQRPPRGARPGAIAVELGPVAAAVRD